MSENVIQTSFSAGELSPSMFARVDFAKYRSGAATMRNFFVDYRSGASTRPGTEFIRPAMFNDKPCRLVKFQQSTTVTYVLEFGDRYIRFVTQGSSVVETAHQVNNVSHTPLALLDVPTNDFVNGQMVFVSGVGGIPQVNNRYFIVTNKAGAVFQILDSLTRLPIDSTNWPPFTGPGSVQRVYTIGTPYIAEDLALLKFSQNAAVMNITHPKYPPHKLQLITATNWVLSQAVFGATIPPPTINFVGASGGGPAFYSYNVTAVDENQQESVISNEGPANGVPDLRTTAGTIQIGWTAVGGADSYNVYGSAPSLIGPPGGVLHGFMGSTTATTFIDSNIAPDFAQTPPIHDNPFINVNPACSSYFQQRLVYANGGGNLVATFWMSKTGAPYNFDISIPVQANDAITAALVSLEVNEIKSMIPMPTGLIMLTTNGAWQVNGGAGGVATQGGPITPITATATPQAYIGANDVPPIVVNYDILFIQAKGSIVRDMTYNLYANIYTGNDISILSSHLFYGHQILEWSYAEEPFKTIWCIREDGTLLGLTLVKEQDMYGWSRHDTLGNFKSVASITEGQNDATYFVVERPSPTGSGLVMQIERLADRTFDFGAEDAWCVDGGTSTEHNFPNSTLAITLTNDPVIVSLISFAGIWTSAMVGWIVRAGGGIARIESVFDGINATGRVIQRITDTFPNDPQERLGLFTAGFWALDKPFNVVYGLDHLEGQAVAVLADGGVVNGLVVHNGSITLPSMVTNVIVGYSFQAQLQTMYLDLGNEVNSSQGKRKKVSALTVRVKDSRGLKAGRTFDLVTPIKELNRTTLMGFPIKLITADERIVMDPLWDVPGQICLQVDDPLPATVLGVIPEVSIGDTGGK